VLVVERVGEYVVCEGFQIALAVSGAPERARSWAQRGSERKACCSAANSRDTKLKSTAVADVRVMRNKRNIEKRNILRFRFLERKKGLRERTDMSLMFLEIKLASESGVFFLFGCLRSAVRGWKREGKNKGRGVSEVVFVVNGSSANLRPALAFGRPQAGR